MAVILAMRILKNENCEAHDLLRRLRQRGILNEPLFTSMEQQIRSDWSPNAKSLQALMQIIVQRCVYCRFMR